MSESKNTSEQAQEQQPDGSPGTVPATPASTSSTTPSKTSGKKSTSTKTTSETKSVSGKSSTGKSSKSGSSTKPASNAKSQTSENPPVNATENFDSQGTVKNIESSSDFEKIHPKLVDGAKVTLPDEKGFYFKLESGRLRRFSDEGVYIDSAPLFTFQERKGWKVKS